MKLVVHASTDPDCPESMRFIGHFIRGGKLLPERIIRSSDAGVRASAAEFLARETERALRVKSGKERRRQLAKAQKASPTNKE